MTTKEQISQVRFTPPFDQDRGIVASLLRRSYVSLLEAEPDYYRAESLKWEECDREVFEHPDFDY